MSNKLYSISILLLIFFLAACSSASAVQPEPVGDPKRGQAVFEDTTHARCTGCHSQDGSEFRSGPSLQDISERAGNRIPDITAAEYLQQSITEPSAFIVEGFEKEMPAFQVVDPKEVEFQLPGMLTQEELDDLIAYLLTQ